MLHNEIDIMMRLDHPSIVKILEYYDEDDQIIIVMEALNGGGNILMILYNFIKKINKLSKY